MLRYLILIYIYIDFCNVIFLYFRLSFSFDWEDISNTQDSVDHKFIANTLKFIKNTLLCIVFSTLFLVFGHVDKDGLLCLIMISYGLRLDMNNKLNNLFICLFSLSSASSSACAGFGFSVIWCNWSCHCRPWWDSAAFCCIIQELCIWQQDTVVRRWLNKYIKILQFLLIQVKFCCFLCNSKQFTNLKRTKFEALNIASYIVLIYYNVIFINNSTKILLINIFTHVCQKYLNLNYNINCTSSMCIYLYPTQTTYKYNQIQIENKQLIQDSERHSKAIRNQHMENLKV